MSQTIENARARIDSLVLTKDYRTKQFTKNFDKHISILIDTTIELSETDTSLEKDSATISDQRYWESESFILEKLDDITQDSLLDDLDNLEDYVYSKIKTDLGSNYDKNDERINLVMDNSINDFMLSVRFNFFSKKDFYINPWESASDIIFDNQVLFSFSKDLDKLKSYGFKIKSTNESELIEESKINIVAKGNRKDYTYGYVFDLLSLRNTVINILEDDKSYGERAIKMDTIISKVRSLGITKERISDSQIKTWIVFPLKRNNKIGSHKEGYFLLKDCKSVALSYESHYANLLGYFRTLENHKKLAAKFGCEDSNFEKHLNFFNIRL